MAKPEPSPLHPLYAADRRTDKIDRPGDRLRIDVSQLLLIGGDDISINDTHICFPDVVGRLG
jgi:hypothetical protein